MPAPAPMYGTGGAPQMAMYNGANPPVYNPDRPYDPPQEHVAPQPVREQAAPVGGRPDDPDMMEEDP
ncbi:hypothetical protein K438DRAFT_1956378 [Mycena galopus ATCC 62051]|nr:hypothetical protein K438DRAFT_1956378 [Mycena galopus ATCC 62051]